jgi:hypothetical protein
MLREFINVRHEVVLPWRKPVFGRTGNPRENIPNVRRVNARLALW